MHLLSRSSLSRGALVALAVLSLTSWCAGSALASNHDTRLTWAVHITLAARWLDPGETEAAITPFLVLYAQHIQSVGEEAYKKNPVGAGPYRFVSFTPGVELMLEAYDGYWRKAPPVKRLVLKSMPEETTRAAALKKGEVDLAYGFTGSVAEEMKRTPGLKLVPVRTNTVFFLDFVEQWDPKSPWADQRVRLAASLAVDRAAINQAEFLGFGGLSCA